MARRHLAKRRSRSATRRLAGFIANPPIGKDLVQFIGPGLGGYAATRLLQRLAFVMVSKRWPHFGRHAGALSSVAAFGILWLLAHKWRRLERYHTPIVVGAGIAAVQSVVQTYIPRVGWILSDVDPRQYQHSLGPATEATPVLPEPSNADDLEDYENDMGYIADDEAPAAPPQRKRPPTPAVPEAQMHVDVDEGGDEMDGLDPDDLGSLSADDEEAYAN